VIRRWIVGVLLGTALIAVSSPLFVRSYVPRVYDPQRRVLAYPSGAVVRWRREGYAETRIGPLGMPGKSAADIPKPARRTVVLWGDSQAEGLCVDDQDKLAAQIERRSRRRVLVLPFARSGDSCNDWIAQVGSLQDNHNRATWSLGASDQTIDIDAHLFLVTELSDWTRPVEDLREIANPLAKAAAAYAPAFLIHAARNVLTEGQTLQPRRLRFRLGPAPKVRPTPEVDDEVVWAARRLQRQLQRLRERTELPCIFVYAPPWPAIIDGHVVKSPDEDAMLRSFWITCDQLGFQVVDARSALRESARQDLWPTGFHNGQFGQGHLNAIGNALVAREVLPFLERTERTD